MYISIETRDGEIEKMEASEEWEAGSEAAKTMFETVSKLLAEQDKENMVWVLMLRDIPDPETRKESEEKK